jgi:hypothetical protein
MLFIIVVTIVMQESLAAIREWISYFNPLLQPCVDKVVSELMILGATAFGLTVFNEVHNITSYTWYPTLHWIDTAIFIFAIFYVSVTVYVLFLMGYVMRKLLMVDAQSARGLLRSINTRHYHSIFSAIDFEHTTADFLEKVRADLHALVSSEEEASGLPHTVIDTGHLPPPPADSRELAGVHGTARQVRDFLTSDATQIEITPTSPSFHDAVYKMVQALVVMNVICHELSEAGEGGEGMKIALRKNPKHLWAIPEESLTSGALEVGTAAKAATTAKTVKLSVSYRWSMSVKISYHLMKYYFLQRFFPKYLGMDSQDQMDFTAYVEVCMIYGITRSFNIGVRDWFVLFVVTVPVVVSTDFGSWTLHNYAIFTAACYFLLITAVATTVWLALISVKLMQNHYGMKRVDLDSLKYTLQKLTRTQRRRSGESLDFFAIAEQQAPTLGDMLHKGGGGMGALRDTQERTHQRFEYSHGLKLVDATKGRGPMKRSKKKQQVELYGVTLSEYRLHKWCQLQLLVQAFYLAVFLCTFVDMHLQGKLPLFSLVSPIVTLLLNLFCVTPCTMFLGYR